MRFSIIPSFLKKFGRYLLPPLLIVGAIVVVVILAMNRPAPEEREVVTSAMLVDVIEARASEGHFVITAQGTVRPRTETTVSTEVSGRLTRLAPEFVAGGLFRAGQTLAEIDPSDYRAALLQAEAELASARARLADEQARAEVAERDWQRMHGEDRQAPDLVLRRPQVAGAEAAAQAAEAAVMRAQRNLERTRISLPYDGMVRNRMIDLGQFVGAGTPLGTTFAVDVAEVRLALSDQDLAFIELPDPSRNATVPVTLTTTLRGQLTEWHAKLVRSEGVVDEATRLTHLVAHIDDPYALSDNGHGRPLPMGTFVQARIQGRPLDGLMQLPRSALRDGERLFVANAEDQLEIRDVTVVRSTPQQVYLSSGVNEGDRVIVTAIQAPLPGMALRVREAVPEGVSRLLGSESQP